MNRKLASVQRVLELSPIAGADAIEAARINGWRCVVKKGTFREGDRGVFFEIDAIPPDLPAYPGTKNQREGVVIRPRVEQFSATLGGRLSFKAISNKYLLGERD